MQNQVLKRVVTTTAATVLLLGGAVAMSPTASAVGPNPKCTGNPADFTDTTREAANLRTGPGTSYAKKGVLYKGHKFRVYCIKGLDSGYSWWWGKVLTGEHKGDKRWVYNGSFLT
ncbi:SH3 domain-containing protein [Streptomyces sp. BA2]|uniref:SH3 domain-containing protein n=1 Tax=Streptomyces sp. BA2 TaxID=436595 RepID=UPI001F18A8B0|nr:SH3 domain-containing protein [Streptomyces sp. BA2]